MVRPPVLDLRIDALTAEIAHLRDQIGRMLEIAGKKESRP